MSGTVTGILTSTITRILVNNVTGTVASTVIGTVVNTVTSTVLMTGVVHARRSMEAYEGRRSFGCNTHTGQWIQMIGLYWRDEEIMVPAKMMRTVLIEYERSTEELYTHS